MKFYSEITSQLYNSEAELNEAESKVKKAECEKKARETKLKNERAARAKVVETAFEEYRKALFEYIESWYNRQRIHSALGYKTPQQVEDEAIQAA